VWKAGKYTGYLWVLTVLTLTMAFGVQQEWLERKFPSPREWSWISRKNYRSTRWDEDADEERNGLIDWARTGGGYRGLLKRLEDPNIDGKGLQESEEGGILVEGVGKTGFDISNKPENWRRGYYEVLMGAAKCAEHLDGWVRDTKRNIAFPANVVLGPSNPDPKPVPPMAKSAPREEDCEPAFEAPQTYYMRILTTQGFTEKQRMDAALAYAAWLDYKNTPESALEMYKWALDIATANSPPGIIDSTTGVLNTNAGAPSANILTATTALAVHHAVNANLNAALPIFLSVLRARKALPDPPKTMRATLTSPDDESGFWKSAMGIVKNLIVPPPFPSPPDDGTMPPLRTAKERCEEAGVMTYIGEILYASKTSRTSREDGLAWTREGVDIAEEELLSKTSKNDKEARKVCKQCLEVGLSNWGMMVAQLARAEKEEKSQKKASWFGGVEKDVVGRWEAEEKVVKERMRRAGKLIDREGEKGGSGNFLFV
jgi:hypothetical protein